ncbi:glucose-1-phosphate cytidylyltransferase [Gluconacetobacter entanii]|uniref:Glucose-1-phosphate cytidylyltransferase n=1 Tax=Gluconacetobacter entanii TaxID=108528 RepID=A0A318PRI4_9PROT|nr:glucose-1-phosphate cytidylyltransferase [Gluconacetobacter entanii]MBY4641606.1 glucose-1-phosphate cytidylyltransferase [Gluconacetobacter entanii]MCW4579360.1 glucose-1-phosphate cytidylyltransferase [Gluconacetobacter entanii]MCW4582760.1 glucose-1-phosphate cytidylyltransferase [Gluconacetobacter entanii]MCW4586174.1 glucose-1-phosphate cytidylyltransferase [Gluconacetobacter entanii]MCW4592158.1 glucose-1-phosphate cytidylyltransferase [Gluconacetobacter entanii]
MKAVILSGGYGTRLMEETDSRPKPMVEIGGRPILWHIMKIYSHGGINDFVIPLGYKAEMIKQYFANYHLLSSDITVDMCNDSIVTLKRSAEPWRVTLVDTGLDTMTGGRLRRLQPYLQGEDFCMTYGDGVAEIDVRTTIDYHHSHGRIATVTAVKPPARFGTLEIVNGCVDAFREKPVEPGYVNGGFFVLSPSVFDYLEDDETVFERGPLERLANDGQLMALKHDGFWHSMDTLRDKRHLEHLWETRNAPWRMW